MAVTQPQVCTSSLKFHANTRFRTRDGKPRSLDNFRRILSRGSCQDLFSERLFMVKLARRGRVRVVGVKAKARDEEFDLYGDSVAEDYYSVLGVLPDATMAEIKRAYYSCMKACHPDLSGNDADTTNFCIFVNEVYEVLSDPVQRMVYDEIHGYSLRTVNPFLDDSRPRDHAFVDEFSCIGCKNCANVAPEIFAIEEDFGRARAFCQSGNPDLVQQAIDSCPVDCIHWTSAAQLSLLEDEMRRVERVNVGLMLANMGSRAPDVFSQASFRWEKRQRRAQERAMIRMRKQKHGGKEQSSWEGLWGRDSGGSNPSSENYSARERASRAAAAARKWREYSRKGVDRRPTCSLPGKSSAEEEKEVQTV